MKLTRFSWGKDQTRYLAISVAIATLCFLYVWNQVLAISGENAWIRFSADYVPSFSIIWALAFDTLGLAAVLWLLINVSVRYGKPVKWLANMLLFAFCALALYQSHAMISTTLKGHPFRLEIFNYTGIVGGSLLVILTIFFQRWSIRLLSTGFLLISPLFLILLSNTAMRCYASHRSWRGNGHAAGMLPSGGANGHRFIWIIFDELDRKMLFDTTPDRIQTPEFDRFQSVSFDATNAQSPAMNTPVALPALLTGQNVSCIHVSKAGELLIRLGQNRTLSRFNSVPNIFQQVRAAGFDSGVSGWLFPYCRMVGANVSACSWGLCGFEVSFLHRELARHPFYWKAWYLAKWQAAAIPFMTESRIPKPKQDEIFREVNIETQRTVARDGLRMVANPDLDFVFIHLPIPHPPGIWNGETRTFTTDATSNYFDNLQLADRFLGKVKRTLQAIGQWENSAVLVSSDHPFRPDAWSGANAPFESQEINRVSQKKWFPYIPYLLKLPFQTKRLAYDGDLNSIVTADLALQLLKGVISTPEQMVEWLKQNESRVSDSVKPSNNTTFCDELAGFDFNYPHS